MPDTWRPFDFVLPPVGAQIVVRRAAVVHQYAQVTARVGHQLELEGWTEWRYAGEGDLDGQDASVEAFTEQEGASE